ncbi:MAG TPA: Crp/Fnr family transcriptional regulator [Thermodesulfobacteriota bacterium]
MPRDPEPRPPEAAAVAYPRLAAWLAGRREDQRAKGTVLFRDGDPYRGAIFLVEGTVTLRKASARGRALILAIESAGHLFAEAPHLTGERTYAVTAHCVEPSRIVRLPPADLEAALRDPLVGREIVENLARKLHRFRQSIFEFTLTDAQRRLHRFLETLARSGQRGAPPPLPVTVTLPVTKHELAELMGITAEALSRTFEALEAAGAVERLPGRALRLLRWPVPEID